MAFSRGVIFSERFPSEDVSLQLVHGGLERAKLLSLLSSIVAYGKAGAVQVATTASWVVTPRQPPA
jgi:hypothetical protein